MRHALESFFKRRFFLVHLALLTLAALLAASTVSAVGGQVLIDKLAASAVPQKPPPKLPTRAPGLGRDFLAAANANIFEGKREIVVDPGETPTEAPPPDDGTCDVAPRSQRVRLVGTVVFSTPEYSLASLVDKSSGATSAATFSVNDCFERILDPEDPNSKLAPKPPPCSRIADGLLLRRIEAERVCLWNESDHRMEYAAIDEPPDGAAPPPTTIAKVDTSEKPTGDEIGNTIKKTGENSYEVGQSDVDKALNNLSDLSTQARIVPAFEGGKTIGFKLFSIRPGSLYSKIGLQNGDIITRINGYEMNDPAKGLEIYTKLKDTKTVNVDLKRRGQPKTIDYSIVP